MKPLAALAILLLVVGTLSVPAEPASVQETDARLEKKVTLRFKRAPLLEIAQEIGKQTGVTFTATPDTRDEPAVVYVTDQPAREVIRQIAEHFGHRWARTGAKDRWSYRLFQPKESKAEEEALRQRDRQ